MCVGSSLRHQVGGKGEKTDHSRSRKMIRLSVPMATRPPICRSDMMRQSHAHATEVRVHRLKEQITVRLTLEQLLGLRINPKSTVKVQSGGDVGVGTCRQRLSTSHHARSVDPDRLTGQCELFTLCNMRTKVRFLLFSRLRHRLGVETGKACFELLLAEKESGRRIMANGKRRVVDQDENRRQPSLVSYT